jgi:hypothetical protein
VFGILVKIHRIFTGAAVIPPTRRNTAGARKWQSVIATGYWLLLSTQLLGISCLGGGLAFYLEDAAQNNAAAGNFIMPRPSGFAILTWKTLSRFLQNGTARLMPSPTDWLKTQKRVTLFGVHTRSVPITMKIPE